MYTPEGTPAQINLNPLKSNNLKAWWYNPRKGSSQFIGNIEGKRIKEFFPPSSGIGNDWVLVLDHSDAEYKEPGVK